MNWDELPRPDVPYAEVIGDPIAQSKSPVIHHYWLEKMGLTGLYRAARVPAHQLGAYFEDRTADENWRGCNVTIPHKETAWKVAKTRAQFVLESGASNLICRKPEGLHAGNTDRAGFLAPIADIELEDADVALIGAGGAARAVVRALAAKGVRRITVHNRSPEKAEAMLETLSVGTEVRALTDPLPAADLLVNASSLGMRGQAPLGVDLSPLPGSAVVYDLVYDPVETELLKSAAARGLRTVDGLSMLIRQAAPSFDAFFHRIPHKMHDAAIRELLTS